jgi:hypothetical protein
MKIKWGVYYFGLIAVTVFFVMACNKARGPVVEQELNIGQFDGIELNIRDNVYIKQGASQRVTIEAQENVAEALNKKIENGIWVIDFESKPKLYKNMKINITVPDLKYIKLNGPGMVITEKLLLDSLKISVNGSGNIDVEGNIKHLHSEMLSNGDIYLEGTAQLHTVDLNSNGRINSFDLESNTASIILDGIGTANVKVKDTLQARLLGDGSIYYKGNPFLNTISTSSGSIIKVD